MPPNNPFKVQKQYQNNSQENQEFSNNQQQQNQYSKTQIDDAFQNFGGNIQTMIKSPFAQMGVQYAQETINQNKNSFLNYVFNHDVRIFFDVDNSYVINKLSLVLFPFLFTGPWKKAETQDLQDEQELSSPKHDLHAADLYIPLMSFMTFILTACFSMGIGAQFKPDLIGTSISKCLFITICELLIIKLCLFVAKFKPAGLMNLLSHISYKYVGLCVWLLILLLAGQQLAFIFLLYFFFIQAFFTVINIQIIINWKTLQRYQKLSLGEQMGHDFAKQNVLIGISLLQIMVIFLISKMMV